VFARIARSGKPYVAAIHGAALGGGLELALACRARVCSTDPRTVLALPEVSLGLIPGAGGTQRLPRLIGIRAAMPMLLAGDRLRAQAALRAGLVDAIAPAELLIEAAVSFAKDPPAPRGPNFNDRLLEKGILRRMFLSRVHDGVMKKTRGLYPAPLAVIECVEAGYARGFEAGCEAEIRHFALLVVSRGAKNLVRIFLDSNEAKRLPKDAIPRKIERAGVLGAGLMGEGIASVSLPLARVVLKDVSQEILERATSGIESSLRRRVDSGSLASDQAERQRANLLRTTNVRDLHGCDLVIEAVFEDLELKQRVLAETEDAIAPSAVYASNTSAIPIAEIAARAHHPERILGMHYFSPVPKMPLLEIVVTPKTEEWAVRTAQAFGVAQGKSVIVVKDRPGFYTTRILAPYIGEAVSLLEEGAGMDAIDEALETFGFAVGPLKLVNKVGIAVAAHVARDLADAFASRGFVRPETLERLAAEKRTFDSASFPGHNEIEPREIADRVVLAMINEAAHALDEGVVASERDADLGAVLGLGFPPFRGGPFCYVRQSGPATIATRLRGLAERYGTRFTPAAYFG
jgi:3-hydroxyacyl-CoA dehydrogenase/enoyl-CoA hydratase/carnithine racemase